MSTWDSYPITYRHEEVQRILQAVQAGECVALVGLSGSGKSNLMGFMANRPDVFPHPVVFVDCNRLPTDTPDTLFQLIRRLLGETQTETDEFLALERKLAERLAEGGGALTLLLDRFDLLVDNQAITSNLRALRDGFKYRLTYITATRHPLRSDNELAELFFGHTLWLGPMNDADTLWNVNRYAERIGQHWGESVVQEMLELTGGYPSLLRAVCEAYAGGAALELSVMRLHPAILRRQEEFWGDKPTETEIRNARLEGLPLLAQQIEHAAIDPTKLTEKEYLLLSYLQEHPEEVCSKDELVRTVWPEDVIYERGVRDDSLAQLVRRLRVKIEPDPSSPSRILTVPGRGYRFIPLDP